MEKQPNHNLLTRSLASVGRFVLNFGKQVEHEPGLYLSDHYKPEDFEPAKRLFGWDDQGRYCYESGEYID